MEGLSLADLRSIVRKSLGGLTAAEMADAEVDRLLNQAFWELEFSLYFKEKECRLEFTTTKGENTYQIPDENDNVDLEAVQSMSIIDENGNTQVMRRMTQQWWDDHYTGDEADDEALPEYWVRMDETFQFHPTPDRSDYTVRIYLLKTLLELVAGSVEELDIPRNWHEIVAYGAVWRAHLENGDINLARQVQDFQNALVSRSAEVRSKEEGIDRYAGLEVAHEPPGLH